MKGNRKSMGAVLLPSHSYLIAPRHSNLPQGHGLMVTGFSTTAKGQEPLPLTLPR